ncbi:MAG: DUF59 domain-containing protein [Mesorhizobium sp.]|nr:MAG: DUF59 domain-containing protein [Mesorhizobium sp.]TGP88041.1 DUF59 domain-containing protein [Mesorhizobium sp. M8A.F.Ca.ET.218.01.1.1]TGT15622.1 DUF59 domain-containing protein [Mesorhizobium sp. M8A.F.Ca.ET.213.01.1.1]
MTSSPNRGAWRRNGRSCADMQPDPISAAQVRQALETVIDPCSRSAGAPAGLVSMGLVGPIEIEPRSDGAHIRVTLYITEPGCMMGAFFKITAEGVLAALPGVAAASANIDYGHMWLPTQMSADYRERLARVRACHRGPDTGHATSSGT